MKPWWHIFSSSNPGDNFQAVPQTLVTCILKPWWHLSFHIKPWWHSLLDPSDIYFQAQTLVTNFRLKPWWQKNVLSPHARFLNGQAHYMYYFQFFTYTVSLTFSHFQSVLVSVVNVIMYPPLTFVWCSCHCLSVDFLDWGTGPAKGCFDHQHFIRLHNFL